HVVHREPRRRQPDRRGHHVRELPARIPDDDVPEPSRRHRARPRRQPVVRRAGRGREQAREDHPLGTITEYPAPTANAQPLNVTVGADGFVWFSESNSSVSAVARSTTNGTITEYKAPTQISSPYGIALGPDGNIWPPEHAKSKIARALDSAS